MYISYGFLFLPVSIRTIGIYTTYHLDHRKYILLPQVIYISC